MPKHKKGRKYAKSETKSKKGRYVSIEQRFAQIEDSEKRIKFSHRLVILKEDLRYLEQFAQMRNISRSLAFEQIVWSWHFNAFDLYDKLIYVKPKKRVLGDVCKMPKLTLHPATMDVLKEYAKKEKISLSAAIYRFIFMHRVFLSG